MENIIRNVLLEEITAENTLSNETLVSMASIFRSLGEENTCSVNESPVRNEDYFEVTIQKYSFEEFKSMFRMSRMCFEKLLCVFLQNIKPTQYTYVTPEKKLLFTIWMLSKQESFLSVSDRFGIVSSTGHFIFIESIKVICKLKSKNINFPNFENQSKISNVFEIKSSIPGKDGAIDGCHIQIKQPKNNATDFYNRKGFHSIILQGICDHKMRFTDIFVGMPGRVHDSKVFKNSPIFKLLESEIPLLNQSVI